MSRSYIIFQSNSIELEVRDTYYQIEVPWSPKVASISGKAYAGFGDWNDRGMTQQCNDLFEAWQVYWLLHHLKSVDVHLSYVDYVYNTVKTLVVAFQGNLGSETSWNQLAQDFERSAHELRTLFAEAKEQYPSAYEILSMWPNISGRDETVFLPELKEQIARGRISNAHLLDHLIKESEKNVDRYLALEKKWAEEDKKKLDFNPEESLFQLLHDIGASRLVDATGEPYDFEQDLDVTVATMLLDQQISTRSGLIPLELFVKDDRGIHHPYFLVQTHDGKLLSGTLSSLVWKSRSEDFYLTMSLEDHGESIGMSIKGLRNIGTPQKEPILRAGFWRRLFSIK